MARPRDPQVDARIIEAARDILADEGPQGITMTAVADRAGVGKPALYRRYGHRAELVFALTATDRLPALPDTGSFESDLLAGLKVVRDRVARTPREALADQFSRMISDEGFSRTVDRQQFDPMIQWLHTAWQRAADRGEVDASTASTGFDLMRVLVSSITLSIIVYHLDVTNEQLEGMAVRGARALMSS